MQPSKGASKSRDSKTQSSRAPKTAVEKSAKREAPAAPPKRKEKAPLVSEWTKEKSTTAPKDVSSAPSNGKSAWSENLLSKLKHQDAPIVVVSNVEKTSEV